MYKRSLFTSITPLPKGVSRKAAVAWLHDHAQMIRLNPLVLRLHETTPAANASADEFDCAWYEITDEISYLPGGLYKGEVTYKACFNDLPDGVQTHTFAPAGLDLRGKWTVGGNEPGEPRERLELGSEAPREGLYIREDVDMRCNILLTGFVKKNLTKSHKSVVDKLADLGTAPEATSGGEDFMHPQAHRQNQPLTPVDSSTVFGPDSYTTGQSSESREGPHPRSESHYVGHHGNSNHQTETLSLHPRSQIISLDPSPSQAPQLPPLVFRELFRDPVMGASSQYGMHQSDAMDATDPATKSSEDNHDILHCLGTRAERSGTVTVAHTSRGGRCASTVVAKGVSPLHPHAPQRVSTDYTWRPGLRPGEFI